MFCCFFKKDFLMWTNFKVVGQVSAMRHVGSWLRDQGSNLHPLHWKVKSWPLASREVPPHWYLDVVLYWLISWSCVTFGFLNLLATVFWMFIMNEWKERVLVTQSCPTLCDPMAPLSMEFSRQEYWSKLPFPSLGEFPYPRIKPGSPALQAASLPTEPS